MNASRKNKCSVCNTIGHNKRRCPTNVNNQNLQSNNNVNMNNSTLINSTVTINYNNINTNTPSLSGSLITVVDVLNNQPVPIDNNSTVVYLNQGHIDRTVHTYASDKWKSITREEKQNYKTCKEYIESYVNRSYSQITKPGEKDVLFYQTQMDVGPKVIEVYKNDSLYSNEIKITAECGSGKSKCISYLGYLLQTSAGLYDSYITPRVENTFLITGWSDSNYVDTMADTMFTIPKNNIFHLNTIQHVTRRIISDPSLLYGMVIFIDEARLVVQKNQTIYNMFKSVGLIDYETGLLNRDILIQFDIKIIYVDATLDTHMLTDIPSIIMKNGDSYRGVAYFISNMSHHSDYDINKEDGYRNLLELFKHPDNISKTHILRLANNGKSEHFKQELEILGYRVFNDVSNNPTRDVDDIDEIINNPRTVIILKGKYRCSKRFRLTPNIGIVYEVPTKEPSDPTITQSLPARFFGYYNVSELFQVGTIFIVNTDCFRRQLKSFQTGMIEGDYNSGLVATKRYGSDEIVPYLKKSTYNNAETTQPERLAIQYSSRAKEGILTSGRNNLCHHREIPDNELYEDQLNRIRNYVPEDATVENWAEYYPTAEKARDRLRSLGANVNTAGNNTQALNVNDNGRLSMFSNFDIGESAILQKFNDGRHIVYRINKTDDNRFQLRWIIKMQNWVMR